jgi:hypothetical protein
MGPPTVGPRIPLVSAELVDTVIAKLCRWQDRDVTGTAPFDDELFERVLTAVNPGDVITTLGIARPNWIVSVDREGVKVDRAVERKGRGSATCARVDGYGGMGASRSLWPAESKGTAWAP